MEKNKNTKSSSHPEQGEQGEFYKWVKASERLPEDGEHLCKRGNFYKIYTAKQLSELSKGGVLLNCEWLCKLSSPPSEGQDERKG